MFPCQRSPFVGFLMLLVCYPCFNSFLVEGWNQGKARAIRFSTLDAICRELNCQPGEILQWVVSKE
ncbi:helix-turn-helix domain-containing protein [Marinilabilia sp.]